MFIVLLVPAFAEAGSAFATATQQVVALSIPALPAFLRMLRLVCVGRRRRLLPRAQEAGAEPRHTLQGCCHPCVSAASRLVQPFCTRPPDFSGAYHLVVLLRAVPIPSSLLWRNRPRSMASFAGSRGQKRQDRSGPSDVEDEDTVPASSGTTVPRTSDLNHQDSDLPPRYQRPYSIYCARSPPLVQQDGQTSSLRIACSTTTSPRRPHPRSASSCRQS